MLMTVQVKPTKVVTRSYGKPFSLRAVRFLLNNAGTMSTTGIANRLGRTVKSIRNKASRLGVSLTLS